MSKRKVERLNFPNPVAAGENSFVGSFGKVKAENPSEAYLSRFSSARRFGRLDDKEKLGG